MTVYSSVLDFAEKVPLYLARGDLNILEPRAFHCRVNKTTG